MKPRKILLFTRPLTPPWDEASKNLAFELSQNMEGKDRKSTRLNSSHGS